MERPSFLSPSAPGARKNVRARLAARKENVSPPSPDEVAAALKARQELAAANRENVLSARKEKAVAGPRGATQGGPSGGPRGQNGQGLCGNQTVS